MKILLLLLMIALGAVAVFGSLWIPSLSYLMFSNDQRLLLMTGGLVLMAISAIGIIRLERRPVRPMYLMGGIFALVLLCLGTFLLASTVANFSFLNHSGVTQGWFGVFGGVFCIGSFALVIMLIIAEHDG